MELKLLWKVGDQAHTYTINHEKAFVLGRKRHCDIVLRDITVSRHHAEIFVQDGDFHLRNISQANPISVYQGQILTHSESAPIEPGYVLQLGFRKLGVGPSQHLANSRLLKLVEQDRTYMVDSSRDFTIGRRDDCDIVLCNTTVSRQHAKIFMQNDQFHICNLSHSSDIYLNTRHIVLPQQSLPLQNFHAMRLGTIKIHLQAIENLLDMSPLFKVQCPGCRRKLSPAHTDCPWCGLSLAGSTAVH